MWQIIVVLAAAIISFFVPTPQELRNSFTAGQNFFASRDYKRALAQYDLILNTESAMLSEDSVRVSLLNNEYYVSVRIAAAYQKANALKQLQNIDSAITIFKLVANNPAEPKLAALAQFQIYDILYQNKRFDESIREAYRLYQKFPDDKKAEQSLYDIGWAYRELNKLDSSSYFFELLLEKYPNTEYYARALYQTAQNNFDNQKYELAIQHWNELITKYRPTIFTEKDWEKVELKAEKERKIYEATQERDVEFSVLELVAKAYVKVGDAYQKFGNYDEAIKSYRIIISTYTMLPSLQEVAWVKIAEATQHKEGIAAAVEIYKEAIDANFNNKKLQAKMQYKIAELYQNEKMYFACADAFDFYINSFGEVADQIDFSQDKAKLSVIAAYYNGKDYTKAIAHSDSFIQKYPTSELLSSVLFLKGSAQTFNREYAEAKSTFNKLIQVFPNSNEIVSANIQLGFIYYKEGNYERALESYEDILTRFPGRFDSSEIFYNALLAQSDLKKYDEALKSFSYVKFGSPYYPSAFGRVVKFLGTIGEYTKADSLLSFINEKDEQVDSVNYLPYINFGYADLNIARKDYNKAVHYLSEIINDTTLQSTLKVIKLQSYYARGALYYQMQKYDSAIVDLETIVYDTSFTIGMTALVPNAKEKLALSYSKVGKQQQAIDLIIPFFGTAKNSADSAKVYSIIANIYSESKEYKKAIETAQSILKLKDIDTATVISSYVTLSNSYKGMGELDKAADMLLEAGEKYPTSNEIPQILFTLGALYFDAQDFEKSIDIFNKFITKFPDNPSKKEAMYYKAYAYYQIGKWEQASTAFKHYIATYPEDKINAEFQNMSGEAHFNNKNFEKAAVDYQQVYRKYPNSEYAPIAMYNEGWCYFQLKEFDKMSETFYRLVEKYPKSPYAGNALFTMGDYYYNNQQYNKANEAYSMLVSKFPNHERVEEAKSLVHELAQISSYLEYEKAMAFFDNSDYKRAVEELQKVIDKYPNADIVTACKLNMASALSQLGNTTKAYEIFKQVMTAVENDPMQTEAYLFAKSHIEYLDFKRSKASK